MAKRRYIRRAASAVGRSARRVYSLNRRRVRRSSSASRGASMSLIDIGFSFGYGYARQYITSNPWAQTIMGYFSFAGAYTDNFTIAVAAYLTNWLLKPRNHYVKLGLRTIVQTEAALAGMKMAGSTAMIDTTANSGGYL